jgi:hypothetical protein
VNGLASNAFESVLRAIALDVPGLHLQPQVVGRFSREHVLFAPDYVHACLTLLAAGRAVGQETLPRRGRWRP